MLTPDAAVSCLADTGQHLGPVGASTAQLQLTAGRNAAVHVQAEAADAKAAKAAADKKASSSGSRPNAGAAAATAAAAGPTAATVGTAASAAAEKSGTLEAHRSLPLMPSRECTRANTTATSSMLYCIAQAATQPWQTLARTPQPPAAAAWPSSGPSTPARKQVSRRRRGSLPSTPQQHGGRHKVAALP
jgi:hypothetical protein